jgi:hypothetical protein
MELHLVADTNLFFECRKIEQLPWDELGYDTVVILLTKPVMDEVDRHKKAGGRTRERAVDLFGSVRTMLEDKVNEIEIQASSPRVLLRRTNNVVADPMLADRLDYAKTDEKLIGITSTLHKEAVGYEVVLFTDDTGPAMGADGVGVPYRMIAEHWRRTASESDEQKTIKAQAKEIAALRAQEPDIAIGCEPACDVPARIVRKVAKPLTFREIEDCLAALRLKHPVATDFIPPATKVETDLLGVVTTTEYTAPEENEVTKYRDIDYPEWIERCRAVLGRLHEGRDEPEPATVLAWSMTNKGSRPALQVRIEFNVEGPLRLVRYRADDEADGKDSPAVAPVRPAGRLPGPPVSPPFVSRVSRSEPKHLPAVQAGIALSALKGFDRKYADLMKSPELANFTRIAQEARTARSVFDAAKLLNPPASLFAQRDLYGLVRPTSVATVVQRPVDFAALMPERHDPEAFYYEWPAKKAVRQGVLTCDLWRHQTGERSVVFEVIIDKEGPAGGVVTCEVHADNLTQPARAKVIIQRTVEEIDLRGLADSMVEACF